jgi:hypothetical protein
MKALYSDGLFGTVVILAYLASLMVGFTGLWLLFS